MDLLKLKTLLATAPYQGLSDAAAADLANDPTRRAVERGIVDAYEVIEATVPSEWASLSAAERQRYQTIVGAGRVNLKGANTRLMLAAMFAAGTATRANLVDLQTRTTSDAEAEGLGPVTPGDVQQARGLE